MMLLKISDEESAKIRVKLDRNDDRVQWQTHPQVDKKVFAAQNVIGLKNPEKPFPISTSSNVKMKLLNRQFALYFFRSRRWSSQMAIINSRGRPDAFEYYLLA